MPSGNIAESGVKILRLSLEANIRRGEKSKYPGAIWALTPWGGITIVPFYPGDPKRGLIPLIKNRGFVDHIKDDVKILVDSAKAVGLEPTEVMELTGKEIDIPGVKKINIKEIYGKKGAIGEITGRVGKRMEQFRRFRIIKRDK